MAGRRIADEEEKIARWRRLGDLGMEEALRESGASASAITAALDLINSAGRQIDNKKLTAIAECLRLEGAKCLLLAVLGRAASPVEFLDLKRRCPEDALNGDEAISLCVNLASNRNVQILDLRLQAEFAKPGRCILLAKALTTNTALLQLRLSQVIMPPEAVKFLMDGVKENSSLESLDLGGNPLFDDGISYVADMLTANTTLKVLSLSETSCGYEGAKHISAALETNTSLESFHFAGNPIGRAGMTMLLTPFVHDEDRDPPGGFASRKNTTITLLDLDVYSLEVTNRENFAVETVASMIRTNKILTELWLRGAPFRTRDWLDQIIPALAENTTLKSLQVKRCKGLNSEGAVQALTELVQFSNTGLEEINVADTAIESNQGVINEELRINKEYRGRLRHQAKVEPKSCRLVLCGYEFAGKTSICETMERIEHGTPPFHCWKMGWKKFLKKHPSLRKFLHGANAYKELSERTRGFDIVILEKELPRTSIWDFAGQKEYYALHDYMFPNVKNSCFLYVCSALLPPNDQNPEGEVKDKDSMRQEFLFWMRFIASNSKLVRDVEGQNAQKRLPMVTFVLSKKDTLTAPQQSQAKQWAEDIVSDFKREFEEVIALSEPIEFVDAHSPEDVRRLLTTVGRQLSQILDQPTEYVICGEVYLALEKWAAENVTKPILSLDQFTTICEKVRRVVPREYRAAELNTPMGRETVLAYLNDVGKIIFSKGLNFIVVNPRWFGSGVLASLINAFGGSQEGWNGICSSCLRSSRRDGKPVHEQGFVRKNRINDILKKSLQTMSLTQAIPSDNLIELMMNLEMCFNEQPVGDVEPRLFMPALFDDESDENATKGLRQLSWNLKGPLDEQVHYIYVGRRLECENKYLTFLTPGFFPRLQVVMQNFLRKEHWSENIGFHVARNLISFTHNGKEVLLEYSGDIDYFVDILVKSSNSFDETLEFIEQQVVTKIRGFCASPQGCQGVLLEEAVIRPVCVEELHLCANRNAHTVLVSTLRTQVEDHGSSYKHHWCRHIEGVSDFDVALELLEGEGACSSSTTSVAPSSWIPQDIPTRFYLTIDDIGFLRKLETKISLAKVMPIKLHLMCAGKHSPHKVEGQPGRTMKVGDKTFPLMRYALSLFWVGATIGGASGGVPLDILPIDRLIQRLFSTPYAPIPIDKLVQMMGHDRSPGPISDQEILNSLKRYLEIDPSCEWLKGFLNLQDYDQFLKDFQLWKVIYINTSQVGWFCWNHFQKGIKKGTVRSVSH